MTKPLSREKLLSYINSPLLLPAQVAWQTDNEYAKELMACVYVLSEKIKEGLFDEDAPVTDCHDFNLIDADEFENWLKSEMLKIKDVRESMNYGWMIFLLKKFSKNQHTPKEEEIKPCPFCGSKPKIKFDKDDGTYSIFCYEPYCPITFVEGHYKTEAEAKAEWNTRAEK